jgi:hypothetical protein
MEKIKIIGLTALIFAVTVVTSCNKEIESASALVGNWTSVSATGKVQFGFSALGTDVAKVINDNIASYDLNDVMNFNFSKEGVTTSSFMYGVTYLTLWDYSFDNNILTLTAPLGEKQLFSISLQGDEFSIHNYAFSTTEMEIVIGNALGEMEVRKRGYESLAKAGITLSGANLTVKFQK